MHLLTKPELVMSGKRQPPPFFLSTKMLEGGTGFPLLVQSRYPIQHCLYACKLTFRIDLDRKLHIDRGIPYLSKFEHATEAIPRVSSPNFR